MNDRLLTSICGEIRRNVPATGSAAPSIETFTATNHDRHPTDLAALRGARLVTAVETEETAPARGATASAVDTEAHSETVRATEVAHTPSVVTLFTS